VIIAPFRLCPSLQGWERLAGGGKWRQEAGEHLKTKKNAYDNTKQLRKQELFIPWRS